MIHPQKGFFDMGDIAALVAPEIASWQETECNPPHEDTDFMGNSPWSGGSAIIRPDGTVQANLAYEIDNNFHISYAADASAGEAILRRQQNLLMLTYAQYGAVVNAADPASGVSMIVSREGGHNRPAPDDLEHYLPYQTSVVKSAGSEETIIYAIRKTMSWNNMDLKKNWRNRNRNRRDNQARKGWYDWIKFGAQMVEK